MKYTIGTGYCPSSKTPIPARDFFSLWYFNTLKHANAQRIVVVGSQGAKAPESLEAEHDLFIPIKGDLGHIRHISDGTKSSDWSGWAGGMMLAAMVAYNDETDFIYKEQDCFAWGDWVQQLYDDMGDGQAVVGRPLAPPHHKLKSSQSLFLVRHAYIWQFVRDYLMEGADNNTTNHGETKFYRMLQKKPKEIRVQSGTWNLDRDRPLTFDRSLWAAQQITPTELSELQSRNLL